ncbi:RagB/SusD family nutrient uptake outer membrane protein [Myroides sp. TSA_177.3]|uniref:RagB/SusD family nutrient uptake outer membrane protein n=1 Tax=Myroides sp. TSA_177.3 TaxID=3415650 RepID=UPI004045CD18
MRYLKYITGIVAGIALVGCSSFLEENPDERTRLDSAEKIKELLVFAYPSANNFYALEAMTDNFGDSKRTQNTYVDNTAYYSWKDEKQEGIDSPAEYWESAYNAIAQANQALQAIEGITTSKENRDGIRGEALLARAYAHWMLAMTFCEAYDPNTADSKLGIPYVNEVEEDLIKEYSRGTLAEFYAKLEADIEEGVKLAPGSNFFKVPSFHFTREAGYALAARFFAFKGDWDKVLEYTNFLGDNPTSLRDYDELSKMTWDQQAQFFGSGDAAANLLAAGTRSTLDRLYPRIRFGYTEPIYQATVGSARFNPFGKQYSYVVLQASQDVNFYTRFYEYFVYSNQSAGIGQPYVNVPLLTTDEAYLYRIEATIMKGEFDKAALMMGYFAKFRTRGGGNEGTVRLNTLLANAGDASAYQPFYNIDETQRKLMKYVSEMRRLEFMHLGNRWYDIKRFNLEVEHSFIVEGTKDVLTKNDPRKAVQLPQSALGAGLTPNPR